VSEETPAGGRPSVVARNTQALTATGLGEGTVRRIGRTWVTSFYVALRNLKMYPIENAVVQKGLEDLTKLSAELIDGDGECEFRLAGEFLFLNATRMKLDLDNYTSFSFLLNRCRDAGVGVLRFSDRPSVRDWTVLLSFLINPSGRGRASASSCSMRGSPRRTSPSSSLRRRRTATTIPRTRPSSRSAPSARTSSRSSPRRKCMNSVRMGQSPNVKKIKRVVQGIVDQILSDETSLVGLTTIRDYDDYTFTHCVNVEHLLHLARSAPRPHAPAAVRPWLRRALPRHRQVARADRGHPEARRA
jgi:hypothetical protein